MPELPEVEVVRRGLSSHVVGRIITSVDVRHPRAVRRHAAGPRDFEHRLAGRRVDGALRRGKYLWLPLDEDPGDGGGEAIVGHLGMSGQLLVQPRDAPDEVHLRIRFSFDDDGPELRFVDQRTFGGLALAAVVDDGLGGRVPAPVAHIARDPLDPLFDEPATITRIRRSSAGIKRVLLDQSVMSGVGNIYADEALWRARLHGARPADRLPRARVRGLLGHVTDVMRQALEQGGTSFDALYVNVNGQSGYFDRSLAAYGQEGLPCGRCGTPIRRVAFMNRSSFFCPSCQRGPRSRHAPER
ncbi:MAG: bifunctional DNA-formamidopyrimidine glycosylase/DNA-(apurinic or apyrimidinic site) lyase [Actinomycetota bacterium]|nr:bifunctional DNA-formamidopyrimidine glycosylase/DNA-(apurinic or apyrimidinic site) lyase [Actinomycetota bacterium]